MSSLSPAERSVVTTSLWTGVGLGVAVDVAFFFSAFTAFDPVDSPMLIPTIMTVTCIVELITMPVASAFFGWSYVQMRPNKWVSAPLGFLEGALLTGVATGIATGTLMAIALPTGAILMNPGFTDLDSWWEGFGMGFLAGGFNGLIAGAVFGAIGGLVISFAQDY